MDFFLLTSNQRPIYKLIKILILSDFIVHHRQPCILYVILHNYQYALPFLHHNHEKINNNNTITSIFLLINKKLKYPLMQSENLQFSK